MCVFEIFVWWCCYTLNTLSRKLSNAFKICQMATIQINFYEYFGSKFLADFWNLEPLCGVVTATLSTLSSRLLAFKGCCACDTLVGLQAFRLNEEPCRQRFLLLFSAFLVFLKKTREIKSSLDLKKKMSYNSPSPRTSNPILSSSSGAGPPLPSQLVTSQRLQNISDSTISISKTYLCTGNLRSCFLLLPPFYLDVSSLIVAASAFVKKKRP